MQTRVTKNVDGWKASTELDLEDRKVLSIRTYRSSRGALCTYASVSVRDEHGWMTHAIGFGGSGGDFSREYATTRPARVTERVARDQHEQVLKDIETIKREALLHYERQAKAKADAAAQAQPRG